MEVRWVPGKWVQSDWQLSSEMCGPDTGLATSGPSIRITYILLYLGLGTKNAESTGDGKQ